MRQISFRVESYPAFLFLASSQTDLTMEFHIGLIYDLGVRPWAWLMKSLNVRFSFEVSAAGRGRARRCGRESPWESMEELRFPRSVPAACFPGRTHYTRFAMAFPGLGPGVLRLHPVATGVMVQRPGRNASGIEPRWCR